MTRAEGLALLAGVAVLCVVVGLVARWAMRYDEGVVLLTVAGALLIVAVAAITMVTMRWVG